MSKSVKWAGTCPDGQVITRTTARTYSHAVIGRRVMPGDVSTPWRVVGWCGRLDLAEALAGRQRRGMAEHGEGSPEVVVIPVAPVVRPGGNVDQVAAMADTVADMARAAVKDLAGGDLAGDLVRSCVDVIAGESYDDVRRALHAATLAQGSPSPFVKPSTLAAVADAVAVSLKYLAGIASDLVNGRYDLDTVETDSDSPHVGADVFTWLQVLAAEVAERDAAADDLDTNPADGVPTVATSWDGAR